MEAIVAHTKYMNISLSLKSIFKASVVYVPIIDVKVIL